MTALEEVATRPDPYSTYEDFLAWASITTRISQKQYTSSRQFEIDLFRLFEKARRFYAPSSQSYGFVLICQVRFQAFSVSQYSLISVYLEISEYPDIFAIHVPS